MKGIDPMRLCPQCKETYDNSWTVCLKCGVALSDVTSDTLSDQFLKFAHDVDIEFRKIEDRLGRIEKALTIEPSLSEKVKPVEVQKIGTAPGAKTQPRAQVSAAGKKGDIESTIGLVWLNRIGILALLFGITFFLKYAFDNRWIGELGRVVLGLVSGFGMIVASEFTRRKKYDVVSQGFHGGGVGILYLSLFAAFGFYHLIGVYAAFVFMSIVTLYCGFWSIQTNWLSSALIGIAGGFLTPFLLGTENIKPALLFSYVLLLDLGVLYMSSQKKWGALNLLSFLFTHIIFFNWFNVHYQPEKLTFALSFTAAFYILFCVLSIVRNLMYKERSDAVDVILVLSNGLVYFGYLLRFLKPFSGTVPGLLPLTLGCIYTGYSYSALKRTRDDKGLILSYVGLVVLFVTIAIPVQFNHAWVSISWALEALVLLWIGFRINHAHVRGIGLVVGAVSVFRAFVFDYSYDPYSFSTYMCILNERMFMYSIIVGVISAGAWLYKRYEAQTGPNGKVVHTVLVLLGNLVLLVQLSLESQTYFAHLAHLKAASAAGAVQSPEFTRAFRSAYEKLFSARELSTSILWIVYALITIAWGMYSRFRALRLMALALLGVAVFKIFLLDLSQLDRFYRIISFVSLGVVLIIASFFYQKYKDDINKLTSKD